jgi:hypothetical protein
MPATEMIVSVALVSAIAVGFIHVLRLIQTAMLHRTVRKVIESDPAGAEAILARLGEPAAPSSDDRLAVILVAVGLAIIGASVIGDDTGTWANYGIGGGLFPLLIGGALLLRQSVIRRAGQRGERQ